MKTVVVNKQFTTLFIIIFHFNDFFQTVPLDDINITLDKTGYSDSFYETVDEKIEGNLFSYNCIVFNVDLIFILQNKKKIKFCSNLQYCARAFLVGY